MTSKNNYSHWKKSIIVIGVFFLATLLLPENPVDPWELFSLKKIAFLILALTVIQLLAELLRLLLGARAGTVASGLLGGFISSTALTASLARKSRINSPSDNYYHVLTYACGTLAMLLEAMILVLVGSKNFDPKILVIFATPLLLTLSFIVFQLRKNHIQSVLEPTKSTDQFIQTLQLTVFILLILSASKILQTIFGDNGLLVLTFLVSLFEIHGSIIANVQMQDIGVIQLNFLGHLLAISLAASYISKLAIVLFWGSSRFKKSLLTGTTAMLAAVLLSWFSFRYF